MATSINFTTKNLSFTHLIKLQHMLMTKEFHNFNLSAHFCNITLVKTTFVNNFDSNLQERKTKVMKKAILKVIEVNNYF